MIGKLAAIMFFTLTFYACSSLKGNSGNGNNGSNISTTTQDASQNRPQKSVDAGKPQTKESTSQELQEKKSTSRPKVEASTARTYEAAPSVPDTL